jgi:hypothetical protein
VGRPHTAMAATIFLKLSLKDGGGGELMQGKSRCERKGLRSRSTGIVFPLNAQMRSVCIVSCVGTCNEGHGVRLSR